MLLAAGNLPDHGCKPWEVDEPGLALQGSPWVGTQKSSRGPWV